MTNLSTSAIILRRLDYSDYDLIITLFTRDQGKVPAIAKYAKKSSRRFAGVLELFSVLKVLCTKGRRKGMPVLQEAAIIDPFPQIRTNIQKTAYASYWAEMINNWTEPGYPQIQVYDLLKYVLKELDKDRIPEPVLSILFQIKFLALAGLSPNLTYCRICKKHFDSITRSGFIFNLSNGGIACDKCGSRLSRQFTISKGALKQLLWIGTGDFQKALRIKFSSQTLKESSKLLEAFVTCYLGRQPASLKVLHQIIRKT
jgi:DNA repair protein RecO (recombination protein O)